MVAIAALAVLGLVARGLSVVGLAQAIATRLVCATDLSDACSAPGPLIAAYGPELAARVEENAPEIDYEEGMSDATGRLSLLPRRAVRRRPRRRRRRGHPTRASRLPPSSTWWTAGDPRPRDAGRAAPLRLLGRSGRESSTSSTGSTTRDSSTAPWSDLPGSPGSHRDDWEGYQVRIGPQKPMPAPPRTTATTTAEARSTGPRTSASFRKPPGASPRATSTSRTAATPGTSTSRPGSVPLRGVRTATRAAVGIAAAASQPATRFRSIGRPSHLDGAAPPDPLDPRLRSRPDPHRVACPGGQERLFAIDPPWRKPVYSDPEDEGT